MHAAKTGGTGGLLKGYALEYSMINWEGEDARPTAGGTPALLNSGALEGSFQGLVEGGAGLFVFLLRDAALFVLHFKLKELVLQRLEKWGGRA